MKSKLKRMVSVLLILLLCMASVPGKGYSVYASEEQAATEDQVLINDVTEPPQPESESPEPVQGQAGEVEEPADNKQEHIEGEHQYGQTPDSQPTEDSSIGNEKTDRESVDQVAEGISEDVIKKLPQKIQNLISQDAAPKAATCISEDRDTGIGQIQSIITDYNFAAAVYDALFADGHLGTDGQSVKEVLATFTGDINANGHVKRTEYTVTAMKLNMTTYESENLSQTFNSQEEAQTYYDSLVNSAEVMYFNKSIIGPTIIEEDMVKPDDQLITDINGIEWLRQANKIDLTYNKITSLMPLAITHLASLTPDVGLANIDSGKKWFGEANHNIVLQMDGNPIQKYPAEAGGRIEAASFTSSSFTLPVPQNITIKMDNPDWSHSLDIAIPEITRDGKQMEIEKNACKIVEQDVGASLDRERLTKSIFPITGVMHSGTVSVAIGGADAMRTWTVDKNGKGDISTSVDPTFKFYFDQSFRVYNETKTEPSTNEATIKITKTIEGTDKPVSGAKYKLYHATIENGQYIKGDLFSDTEYTTNKNGEITITEELPLGDYCFVESKAPSNFVLDETTIGFTLTGGTVTLGGGDHEVTPTGGETVTAGENETFIDRYSADITLTVTADEGNELGKVIVTYLDHETQKKKTESFDTAQEAQDWINTHKGNTETVGVIDGLVTIKAVFKRQVDLTHTNTRSKADFSFIKVNAADDTAMEGVKFTLTCSHKHDESCGGLTDSAKCTHGHNDTEGHVDEKGCMWETTVTSDSEGKVIFPDLISATYILKEVETLNGFILPSGTWTVTVDADKDTDQVQVERTNAEGANTPEFESKENEDGTFTYYLKNIATIPFSFTKVDGSDHNSTLAGVVFELYECKNTQDGHKHEKLVTGNTTDCWTLRETVTSDDKGVVKFEDLTNGDYQLVETKANADFELPTGQWFIHVEAVSKKLEITAVGDKTPPAFEKDDSNGDVSYTLPNYKKKILPMAGGKGTALFTYFGVALLAAGGLVGMTKNKRKRGCHAGRRV